MKSKDNTYRPADVFDDFIKEVFAESPLEQAFRNWKEIVQYLIIISHTRSSTI